MGGVARMRKTQTRIARPDDQRKTKQQLLDELRQLGARVAELEALQSQQARTEEALRRSWFELDQIFRTASEGIRVVDDDFIVVKANDAMARLTGVPVDQMAGKKCYETFQGDRCGGNMCPVVLARRGERMDEVETVKKRPDGTAIPCLMTAVPLLGRDGELVGTVEALRDISALKEAQALGRLTQELALRNRIGDIFLIMSDEDMYPEVLTVLLETMQSRFGTFGYIDENGALVVPTMTRHIWDQCEVADKTILFPRATWGDSTWARAVREKRTIYSKEPSTNVPEGHIPIQRHISMPIIHRGLVVGLFQVANKERDYDDEDIARLERIAEHVAPILSARVQRDIQERARAEAERQLALRARELERSNAELEQFAYVASHDLQEPLRMVTSYVELLARRYEGKLDSDANEFIGYAVDGARRMQQLVQGLLALSRVQTQGDEPTPTDTEAVLEEALASLQVRVQESGAVVTHGPLPTVAADEVQLGEVFQNLIGNAIKFRSEEPPRIHVSAERRDSEWAFSVQDNGIGIDAQHQQRVFGIFQRLHGREEYSGVGIGLALCKRIVERHRGRVWVESEPGRGATFYFTIPSIRFDDAASQNGGDLTASAQR